MSIEWVVVITAFLGTILGAAIPSGIKIFENQLVFSNETKGKYEYGTRLLFSDYIPAIKQSIVFIRAVSNLGYSETYYNQAEQYYKKAMIKYQNEIKDQIPLKIFPDVNELNDHLGYLITSYLEFLKYPIENEGINKKFSTKNLKKEVKKINKRIKKIEKVLKRKYS